MFCRSVKASPSNHSRTVANIRRRGGRQRKHMRDRVRSFGLFGLSSWSLALACLRRISLLRSAKISTSSAARSGRPSDGGLGDGGVSSAQGDRGNAIPISNVASTQTLAQDKFRNDSNPNRSLICIWKDPSRARQWRVPSGCTVSAPVMNNEQTSMRGASAEQHQNSQQICESGNQRRNEPDRLGMGINPAGGSVETEFSRLESDSSTIQVSARKAAYHFPNQSLPQSHGLPQKASKESFSRATSSRRCRIELRIRI